MNAATVKEYQLVDKHRAAELAGMSWRTLNSYRQMRNSPIIEGVHYKRINLRVIYYRAELIQDWAVNRDNPEQHLKTIEEFLRHQKSGTSKDLFAAA